MIMFKRFSLYLLVGAALLGGLDFVVPGGVSIVSTAQAEVGRPLTPVSVAGVARRTARRN
ncbi:MAG: hypothetical protein DMF06_07785 [Verrucomicrobia bacterium]|jgi:hypothetical protein|nr:MAG: hypothetical protein DMF06_07785 [Verrucomicrobiota bacterium]